MAQHCVLCFCLWHACGVRAHARLARVLLMRLTGFWVYRASDAAELLHPQQLNCCIPNEGHCHCVSKLASTLSSQPSGSSVRWPSAVSTLDSNLA